MAAVVDTNVLATANEYASHAPAGCVKACIRALRDVQSMELILLDDGMRIFREYFRQACLGGAPGPGDFFLKWVWDNQEDTGRCRKVRITPKANDPEDFEEFPNDPALRDFHRRDRKWVAVGLASGLNPRVLNATDTDWWKHRTALGRWGIRLEFLCPELMRTERCR